MSIVDRREPAPGADDEGRGVEIAFIVAHEHVESLADWIERYPEHALALTDLAIALDLNARESAEGSGEEELAEAAQALRQARDQVLGIPPSPASPGLVARAHSLGVTIPQLAHQLELAGDILFKLDHGFIRLETVPQRLLARIAAALEWPTSSVAGNLIGPRPAPAFYYADRKPEGGTKQSFAEALDQSEAIAAEDRVVWLAAVREEDRDS